MTRPFIRKKSAYRWATAALSVGSTLAALGAANAQTPAAGTGETTTAERVIVTGSNIPSAAEVGSAPVTTVDAAAIGRSGVDDPQVVLQKSDPSFTGGGNLGASNSSVNSGATNGGSQVSIRGLPTLVLLNGRRVADSAALASGGNQFADVNLFPTALIKRIEVLKDGASAIYGSDAVGGVVNVLLNDDFQGVAVSGRFGFAERADIQDQRYSGVAGFGDDHTRIVVAAQYQEQDPIFSGDRDFSRNAPGSSNFGDKITVAGGSRYLNTGLPSVPNQIVPFSVAPILNSPSQTTPAGSIAPVFNAAGQQVFSSAQFPAGTYNTTPHTLLLQQYTGITLDQNRTAAYGSVERDIIDKHLIVFGDFLYSRNYSQSYLAPQPVATNSSPNPSQNLIIALGAPFNPFNSQIGIEQAQIPTGLPPAGAPGAAVATTRYGNLVVSNRFLSAPRVFRNDTDFYRIVAGLKGEIIKDYNYEVAFNHSEDTINFKNFNLVRGDLVNQAIAGGYNADGTAAPATFNANGTVATPAGAYSRVNGVLTPALDPFALNNPASTEGLILGTDIRNQQSKLTVIDGKLTGFPVNLPAGPVGFAIGGEYRREELRLNSSVENFVASVPAADVQVGRDIEAAYLELSIPAIGPNQKIPGVYSFDIDGAVRYEHYEGTGDNVTPKASFVYRPIVDVAIRGTYAKSFRAPNLIETNGPPGSGFTALTNLGAGYNEQANVISASNPALGPERTDSFSGGIVLSPHQVPGLTISGDFFHEEERNIITGGIPSSTILQTANTLGSASPYNALIHVGSQNGPNLTSTAPGQITGNASNFFIITAPANNSNIRISGVDFTVNYDHDFGPKAGGFTLGLNGTYYFQYKLNDFKDGTNYDVVGLYLGGIGGNYVPDYKLVPYAEYRYGGASISALVNYLPSMRDGDFLDSGPGRRGNYTQAGDANLPKIRDYYDIDMTLSYEFGLHKPAAPEAPMPAPKDGKDGKDAGKDMTSHDTAKKMMAINLLDGLKLTFGVNNITNARPPKINASPDSSNSDVAVYDPFQRYYYFVVSKKF